MAEHSVQLPSVGGDFHTVTKCERGVRLNRPKKGCRQTASQRERHRDREIIGRYTKHVNNKTKQEVTVPARERERERERGREKEREREREREAGNTYPVENITTTREGKRERYRSMYLPIYPPIYLYIYNIYIYIYTFTLGFTYRHLYICT